MPLNRIITRGMGASRGKAGVAGLITQGYGGFFRAVVQGTKRLIKAGRSSAKKKLEELEEIIVRVKLVTINEKTPEKKVEGFLRVGIDRARHIAVSLAQGITAKVNSAYDSLKVTILKK